MRKILDGTGHRDGAVPFRLEFVLRDFARPKPMDIWFRYPIHEEDASGALEGCRALLHSCTGASIDRNGCPPREGHPVDKENTDAVAPTEEAYMKARR